MASFWLWLAIAVCMWGFVCNGRTYRHRLRLVEAWGRPHGPENWRDLMADYRSVSYGKHLFALMLFVKPEALYSERLIDAMRKLP